MTVARGEELPLIEAAIFAAVVGISLGFVVFVILAPRLLALVPATRAGAAETAVWLTLLIPGLITFATWLLLPVIGLRDGDQLLGISVVIFVAVAILPMPFMFLAIWRAPSQGLIPGVRGKRYGPGWNRGRGECAKGNIGEATGLNP